VILFCTVYFVLSIVNTSTAVELRSEEVLDFESNDEILESRQITEAAMAVEDVSLLPGYSDQLMYEDEGMEEECVEFDSFLFIAALPPRHECLPHPSSMVPALPRKRHLAPPVCTTISS